MSRDDGTFLEELQYEVQSHTVVRHPFLQRFAEGALSLEQLRTYAAQHYLYARRFSQNLAALISNTPDEHARMLLILNMYEEIGEPARIRDRVHLLLLEHGLVSGRELGETMEELGSGSNDDVVSLLIEKRIVTRGQVTSLMELNTKRARDFTHPALFRRFLGALGLNGAALSQMSAAPETETFSASYERLCRSAHWLEGMGAMGPGTECVVAPIYSQILDGLKKSAGVSEGDCVFWTIHVHCDDGHGRNFIEAVRPYMNDAGNRELLRGGALAALEARERWLDGIYRQVFHEEPQPARKSRNSLPRAAPPVAAAERTPAHSAPSEREARAFSERGDQVFRALASRFPKARTWRLLIEQPLPEARFAAIRAAMLEYVSDVLGSPFPLNEPDALKLLLKERQHIANFTSGGMLAPKREHTRSFNALHRAVAASFLDFGIEPHVDGIDLPINVRMVYGEADPMRKAAPFASSKRHADVWAGVPADAVVVVLPVLGDIDNLTIECAEMPVERELSAMCGMRDYDEGADIPVVRSYDACKMKHGHVYMADVRLLHQTVRRAANGVRLSVDFRFRTNDLTYRAMAPALVSSGPDSIDTRVPYSEWLALGRERVIEFEETMSEARSNKSQASSAPVNLAKYRIVPRAEES
jgi:pyrroloquinoline quinone (PQQ) biosynthesis protein C